MQGCLTPVHNVMLLVATPTQLFVGIIFVLLRAPGRVREHQSGCLRSLLQTRQAQINGANAGVFILPHATSPERLLPSAPVARIYQFWPRHHRNSTGNDPTRGKHLAERAEQQALLVWREKILDIIPTNECAGRNPIRELAEISQDQVPTNSWRWSKCL